MVTVPQNLKLGVRNQPNDYFLLYLNVFVYSQYLFSHIKLNKVEYTSEYTDNNFNVFLFRIISNKTAMSSAQRQGQKICKYITIVKLLQMARFV